MQKFIKTQNSESLNVLKWQFYDLQKSAKVDLRKIWVAVWNLQKLISRKIWVAEKSLNLHTAQIFCNYQMVVFRSLKYLTLFSNEIWIYVDQFLNSTILHVLGTISMKSIIVHLDDLIKKLNFPIFSLSFEAHSKSELS